jgi:integrase
MARKQLYLQKREGVYHLRVRVPDALRSMVGKREIRKSLHSDRKEAERLALLERANLLGEWDTLRRQLAPIPTETLAPLETLARADTLSEVEIFRLVTKWFVEEEKKNADPQRAPIDRREAEMDLSDIENWDIVAGSVSEQARRLLKEEGIELEPSSPAFTRLQHMLHRAWIETERRLMARHYRDHSYTPDVEFQSLNQQTVLQPVAKNTLATVMKAVENDPTKPKATGKTATKRYGQWRVIKEFFGEDTDMKAIPRQRVREFMALLEKLPSNASKHFPDKTVFEAVELGDKLPKLTPETANGYLRMLGGLFRYALNEGMIDADPSAGLLFQKSKVRAKDKRLPFDTQDLRAVFTAPLYAGCIDDGFGYSKPGPNIIRRGRFWVPLIALYSGMRLNEICQLTLDDFVVQDGVDIMLIRDGDDGETKRVKTDAGVRFVPVHPELRRIGLLDYIEEQRRNANDTTAPAFPDLPVGSTGYRSDPFSKWFAIFLDRVGVKHAKKVFHSFRHTYRDALREADISREKVRALGGWTSGTTDDDYGSGLRASTLAKDIENVRYRELDLSHLYLS